MRSSPASSLDLLFEPIKVCVRHVGVEFAEFPVVVAINPVAAAPDVADDHLRQPGLKLPRIPTGVMFPELELLALVHRQFSPLVALASAVKIFRRLVRPSRTARHDSRER